MRLKRIAYVKGGDAATELEEVGRNPTAIPEGGPRLYVTTILHLLDDQELLMLSMGYAERTVTDGPVTARTTAYGQAELRRLKGILLRLKTLGSVVRQVRRFKPQLVYCPLIGPPLWAAALAARLSGAKLIHSRHSMTIPTSSPVSRLVRTVDRRILKKTSALACHGRFLEDQLLADGMDPNKIFRFEPGFRAFHDILKTNPPGPPGRTILFVGRVVPNKGTRDLFAATAPLLRADPTLRLAFAGPGPDQEPLRELATNAGLSRQVDVLGPVPHADLATLMAESLCVATPTHTSVPEGRNKAVAESLVAGRPVVAPDFGPFAHYLLHDKNALLYTPDSVDGLGQALKALATDPALLDRLAAGAARAGQRILDPEQTFGQAMAQAIATAGFEITATP